jgi:tetratricopeptide (TPR) repeat protein
MRFAFLAVLFSAGSLCAQEQQWRQLRDGGQVAFVNGDFAVAEQQWVAAYNEARTLGVKTEAFTESQRNLAALYSMMWRFDEAGAMLRDAGAMMKAAGREPSEDWQMLLTAGRLELAESDFTQASPDLASALRMISANFGEDHPQTAEAYLCLGTLEREQEMLNDAAENLHKAAGILSESSGAPSAAAAHARAEWSRLLVAQARYVDAVDQARRAVDLARKADPPSGRVTYDKGKTYFRSQLGRIALGDSLLALGEAYAAQGRLDDASIALEQALATNAEVFGEKHLPDVPCLAALAEVSLRLGNSARASQLAMSAESICKQYATPEWLPMARVFLIAAKLSKRPEETETLFREAADIATKRAGAHSLLMAEILEARGDARLSSDVDKAENDYRQAMAYRQSKLPESHPDIARSLIDVARVYDQRREPDLAESFYKRAIQTLESAVGNDSFILIPPLQSYETFLRLQKRSEEADGIEDRISRLRRGRE